MSLVWLIQNWLIKIFVMPEIGASCQYDTVDKVVGAYQNREVPAFAIFCGKQFMFKYEGTSLKEGIDLLEGMLKGFGYSAARYTLCVYEKPPADGIKSKTDHDGSFNFQLQAQSINSMLPGLHSEFGGNLQGMVAELRALRESNAKLQADYKKLADEMEEMDEPEPKSAIGQILEYPAVGQILDGIAAAIVSGLAPKQQPAQPASARTYNYGAINGVGGLSDDEQIKEALQVLSEIPDWPALLAKMARMYKAAPGKFVGYMGFFRSMKY
jgi:hypothetical protein